MATNGVFYGEEEGLNLTSGDVTRINISTGGVIKFNNAYTFPTSDGSQNTVLLTSGSGALSFETVPNAGLTNSSITFSGTTGTSPEVDLGGTLSFISSDGTVRISGNSTTYTFDLSGGIFSATTGSTYSTTNDLEINGSLAVGNISPNATDGRIDASNDVVAFSSSDKRWKKNINPIESPLEKLQKLSGVEFDWIEDIEVHGNKGNDVGVIAQEVEEVLPQAVQTRDSGMKAVRYEKLIPLLIETIKEQQKQINELKNKIG